MKSNSIVVKLLTAIYLETLSVGLMLIAYISSGGESNGFSAVLFVLALLLLVGSILVAMSGFANIKEKS